MAPPVKQVIMVVVSLMVIALIFPIGLGLISAAGDTIVYINGTGSALSTLVDPSVLMLLTVLLPILAVIGLVMYFIPRGTD